MSALKLAWQLKFEDLYSSEGVEKIDAAFLNFLKADEKAKLLAYRACGEEASDFILWLAPKLEAFLARLFDLEDHLQNGLQAKAWQDLFFECKKIFVSKRARIWGKKHAGRLNPELIKQFLGEDFSEMDFVHATHLWRKNEPQFEKEIEAALHYAAFMLKELQKDSSTNSLLFTLHEGIDFDAISPRPRDGFDWTDKPVSSLKSLDEAYYCLLCHERGKDSCRKDLRDKKTGERLKQGCPLRQHISEMHFLRRQNHIIGALAALMVNNPLCPATGHRICNSCVEACIFQKQPGVGTPKTESEILRHLLNLDWGFEIYALLAKWNPLRAKNYKMGPSTGKKILVVGQGPAGFALAYYALQSGHKILAIDGLKIEPLAIPFAPIQKIESYFEALGDRIPKGFGGVAEYGITARWDKNMLLVIRLLLERYPNYSLQGGVFYGGTLTEKQAFEKMEVDHIALATGAGAPKPLGFDGHYPMPKGVRFASDFLMALQSSGAYLKDSPIPLEVELPALVIGGGLTAIDAATELQAYYIKQVEYYKGSNALWLNHGKAVREERAKARAEKRLPNFAKLIQAWGGVKIIYRGKMEASPAYRLNKEELAFALAEGIEFCEQLTPIAIEEGKLKLEEEASFTFGSLIIAIGTEKTPALKNHPFFVKKNEQGQSISYLGDRNAAYSGSVVHAIASAKDFMPYLNQQLAKRRKKKNIISDFSSHAEIISLTQLRSDLYELAVKAPLAARNFAPGQFYRVQAFAPSNLMMRPLALSAFNVDKEQGILHFIFLKKGQSTQNLAKLKKGDYLSLMGPAGAPSLIPENKNMCLIGGGVANVVLFEIGKAARAKASNVTYFAAYKDARNIFKQALLEAAADRIIYCIESGEVRKRPQDIIFRGNVIEGLKAHQAFLQEQEHILTIGSEYMMAAIQKHSDLFPKKAAQFASVNAPMQCMMGGVCGSCVQRRYNLKTGKEELFFACAEQDQDLEQIDFDFLKIRLSH